MKAKAAYLLVFGLHNTFDVEVDASLLSDLSSMSIFPEVSEA
jgi:hypothetical protein